MTKTISPQGQPDPEHPHEIISYQPSATCRRFHDDISLYRGIMGPVGSGKSTACVMEIYTRATEQQPWLGVRYSRFAVIRNTYPELISTSMKTWREWVPETICPISMSTPITGRCRQQLSDGTRMDMEVFFLALDKDDDVRKLKSLELTGIWINEASEVSFEVVKMSGARVGRFPPERRGGCTWRGVVMDTNPPDTESWWHELAEHKRPKTYAFFKQPPAILPVPRKNLDAPQVYVGNDGTHGQPAAENVRAYGPEAYDYWLRQTWGADDEWIKVFLMGQYGRSMAGKPVYPEYVDSIHCAPEILEPFRGVPLILGWDFGRTPCCAFCQLTPKGQFLAIDELASEDMGIRQFARDSVKPYLSSAYGGMVIDGVSDPQGVAKGETDEISCLDILAELGLPAEPGRTQHFKPRRESVARYLLTMVDGKPGFLMSPRCKILRKGFQGGYRYKRERISTGEVSTAYPEKNEYSHLHDALQYSAMKTEAMSVGDDSRDFGGLTAARAVVVDTGEGWT